MAFRRSLPAAAVKRRVQARVQPWVRLITVRRIPLARAVPLVLALLITAYAGLLRLDAYVAKYGALDHPGVARVLTRTVAPAVPFMRPTSVNYLRESRPYAGGDPHNYLRFAREMQSFYQPHVREPVFLALTRGGLWLLDNQDAAVSLASVFGSLLAVFAAYLLGAAIASPAAGLAAALAMAIEYDNITWAVDGWRDDTFTAAVALAAWAFIRFRQHPSFGRAAVLGVTTAAACLTRITALSFVVPALLWLLLDSPRAERRARATGAVAAVVVLAALFGPYLASCALATGDPFYAINYHTVYYRYGEGLPSSEPMSAGSYLLSKVASMPIGTVDTGITGVFVWPFITKWVGFGVWLGGLGTLLAWLACAGLVLLLFAPDGRLLLVVLFGSLLPYAFTWNIAGGDAWRFTMHAYPFFLVAASYAIGLACKAAARGWRRQVGSEPARLRAALRTGAVTVLIGAAAVAAYAVLPWFVIREAMIKGQDVSVGAGSRDAVFFGGAWSPALKDGNISARVSTGDRAVVRLPLPARRDYDLVLRLDPAAPGVQQTLLVRFNRHRVAALPFSWDPQRIGSYRLHVTEQMVRAGINELTLAPDALVPAASAGGRYGWLRPAARVGVRFSYVRVLGRPPEIR